MLYSEACHEFSMLACISHCGAFAAHVMRQPQCCSLEESSTPQAHYFPSLFWRSDGPIRTEWTGICHTLKKDLSQPLTAMAACHGRLQTRTRQTYPLTRLPSPHLCSYSSKIHVQHLMMTQWKNKIPIFLAESERERALVPPRYRTPRSTPNDRRSWKAHKPICYFWPDTLWNSKLHSWHLIFVADTPCTNNQEKVVTSSWWEDGQNDIYCNFMVLRLRIGNFICNSSILFVSW